MKVMSNHLLEDNFYATCLQHCPFDPSLLTLQSFWTTTRITFIFKLLFYIISVPSLIAFDISVTAASYADLVILCFFALSTLYCLVTSSLYRNKTQLVIISWGAIFLRLLPQTSVISPLSYLNIEYMVTVLSIGINWGKRCSYIFWSKYCMVILVVIYFIICGAINLLIAITVIILKLSQVNFDDVDLYDNIININGKYDWSWNQLFVLLVVLYQIVNVVPVEYMQRRRLVQLQKKLFGEDYFKQKGNLYRWIIIIMRKRGCGYLYIFFYIAAIDYDGVEDILKLIIEHNPLHQNHQSIDIVVN